MAGGPPPAGGFRASLTRAAARLITPFGYLGVLGGLQVGLLWVLRGRYGVWLALIATTGLIALLGLLLTTTHHWRLKLWGVAWLGALTAIGPTLPVPRSKARPLEDARQGTRIWPATALNKLSANRLR